MDMICFMYGEKAAKEIWNKSYPKYKGTFVLKPSNVVETLTKNNGLMQYCETRRQKFLEIFGEF